MRGLHGFDALPTRVVRYCDTVRARYPTGYTIVRPPRRSAQASYCVCTFRSRVFGASARRVADGTRYGQDSARAAISRGHIFLDDALMPVWPFPWRRSRALWPALL